MSPHVIAEYDRRILALETERDRLLSCVGDIKTCLNTGNRLDLADMQRTINSAVSMCRLALRNEQP